MRRFATVVLLAAPLLLASAGTAAANNGPCTFGYGCPGFCLRLFPHMHQHGPLFNYGPYYGYPPFEPYGSWNSYLHYTGPVPPGGGAGPGAYGWIHGGYPRTFGHGNPHPLHLGGHGGGILHHGGGIFHKRSSECSTCGTVAGAYLNSGNAIDRYTGVGSPAASAAYYSGSPGFSAGDRVIPVSLPGR